MQLGTNRSRRPRRLVIAALGCALFVTTAVSPATAEPLWPGGPDVPGVSIPIPSPIIPPPSPADPQPTGEPPLGRANFSTPVVEPADGETVGIAQPVIIGFTTVIDDKKNAENAIRVSTEPEVEGAYQWVGNKELRWKPTEFWPPGTAVVVEAGSATSAFTIGEQWVATADDNTHTISVSVDGAVVRTMPTSMGANDSPTPNGIYTVGERYSDMFLDSSTYGVPVDSPGGYRTYVEHAARLSNSGIFVHAAPWSLGQQGNTNVSRGCLNLSPEDARWFYDNAPKGAPVIVQNTIGGTIDPADGLTDFTTP